MPNVTFSTQLISPPSNLYVTVDDFLLITTWSSVAAEVQVNARLLRAADGIVVQLGFPFTTNATRGVQSRPFSLAEGFLLSLTAANFSPGARRGQTYVSIQIQRAATVESDAQQMVLAQGYITQNETLSWPPTMIGSSIQSPGFTRAILGAVPAAGAEIIETVPGSALFLLKAVRFALTTGVAAPVRTVHLVIDDGANIYARVPSPSTQAASLTVGYNGLPAAASQVVTDGQVTIELPAPVTMAPGHRLRTLTTNLAAADQYTAPTYLVEEWIRA